LIDIAVKGWQACKTHHRGPIGCAGRHPRWWPKRSSGGVGKLEKQIAAATGVSPATVSRVLRRLGLNKLSALEPAEPIRRYECEHLGELIHLDIKKLGRIGSVGHRITGRYPGAKSTVTTASVGSSDDASRIAFVQVLVDQRKESAVAFLEVPDPGIQICLQLGE
jgi:hypothetical protein